MLSGRRLDLLDPSPLDIEIEDIAHGLSRVARWNGQTSGKWAYSVAQHSLLVDEIARHMRPDLATKWQLAVLLHDAPEFVIGDLITPFKSAVGQGYKALENRLSAAIHLRFALPASLPTSISQVVKRADRAAAYLEAIQLAGFEVPEAKRIFNPPRNLMQLELVPCSPNAGKKLFLQRFKELGGNLI
ncbi:MAG: HD family hydrolase [Pseudomonadota bacterium]